MEPGSIAAGRAAPAAVSGSGWVDAMVASLRILDCPGATRGALASGFAHFSEARAGAHQSGDARRRVNVILASTGRVDTSSESDSFPRGTQNSIGQLIADDNVCWGVVLPTNAIGRKIGA